MTLPDEVRSLLERVIELIDHGDFAEGHCMCGSPVDRHGLGDGHSPVDAGDYYAGQIKEEIITLLAAQPEPQGVELEVVGYRYRHSAEESWQYGRYDRALWDHEALVRLTDAQRLLSTERAEAERKMAEKDAEIAELDALCNRLSDLLRQSVIAIRGPEPELTRYGWADLPLRVKTVVDENAQLRARLAELESALRRIMEQHRFNVAGMSVTDVHSACFDALSPPQANSQEQTP